MGGWGEGFFSFFFGPQCVPQQNITMCSFSLPPIKTPRTPPPPPPPPPPPLHEKNKIHGPPNHAFFGKEKSAPKSPHPPSKSQKYLPQHPTIPHPKVDIFNFLDCPPIEASLGLSALSTYIKESVCVRPSTAILLAGTQSDILLAGKLKVMGITRCQEKSLSVMGITRCQEKSLSVMGITQCLVCL